MKKLLTLFAGLVLSQSSWAEQPPERVVLLVGKTAQAQQQVAKITERLLPLSPFEVIRMDSKEGEWFQAFPEATYLLRQVGDKIVWQRPLVNPDQVLADFQASTYDVPEGKLLSWYETVPPTTETPLRSDDLIELFAGGRPGLKISAQIGGQQVPLHEDRPGFYAGAYRVKSEDRVETVVTFQAEDSNGTQETLQASKLAIQGLEPARLTGIGQATLREWVLEGEAAPGTSVVVEIDIRFGSLIGKQTIRRKVEAVADEDGRFEAIADLGTLSSSPKGTVTLRTFDSQGVETVSHSQNVQFVSQVLYRPDPWSFGPGPWGRRSIFWGGGCGWW